VDVKGFAAWGMICGLMAAACPAAYAGRGHYPQGSPAAKAAQAIAVKHWHQDPCGGDVSIGWSPMAWDTYANSTWSVTSGGRWIDCRVEFNSRVTFSWSRYCTIMVHEYGHLIGLDHSSNPKSIMFARPRVFRGCAAAAIRRAASSSGSRR
jgi:hypothetical protein